MSDYHDLAEDGGMVDALYLRISQLETENGDLRTALITRGGDMNQAEAELRFKVGQALTVLRQLRDVEAATALLVSLLEIQP